MALSQGPDSIRRFGSNTCVCGELVGVRGFAWPVGVVYWCPVHPVQRISVNIEEHSQPHGLVNKPQRPELLQNKPVLGLSLNGQDF